MTVHFIDGEFINQDDVRVSIDDRGYYFGDGVYEVIKVYDGELYTAHEHLSRLYSSANKIKIDIPFTEPELLQVASELLTRNNVTNGQVYIQVTRGVAPRQHNFPSKDVKPMVTAYALETKRPLDAVDKGVSVKSVVDVRWLLCDIKSLNLLGSVLAKQEAKEANCFEALLHRDGFVTEGSSTNIFGVKEGVVYTHPATNLVLNGITRQVVLRLCNELAIPSVEKEFTLEATFDMDELFLTSTTSEIMPITKLDDRAIGNGEPGVITKKLQEAFNLQIPLSKTKKL